MKKRIIMYVYSDITTDARVQRAADALSKDYELTLISTFSKREFISNNYKTIFVGGRSNNSIVDIFSCILEAKKIIKEQRPDIVYCHDYYSSILARLIINKKYCRKIIYDAHELFVPSKEKPLDCHQQFFYWIEKSIVNKVDLLIGTNSERVDIMQRHYKLIQKPVVIRNISQLQISSDNKTSKILDGLSNFFSLEGITLVYAGCVSKDRKIDSLLKSALRLSDKYKVLIVGDGNQLDELKEFAKQNTDLKIAFTGKMPYSSLGAVLSRCDIGYLNYPIDILNNIYCASNKVYEYASVGLPILANNNPTVKKILEDSHIGVATDNFDEGLLFILGHIEEMKKSCTVFSRENCWEKERQVLIDAVNKIS